MSELSTPVALLVFNRPELTRRVFEAVARARPRRLLVVADGPRASHPGEAERCAAVRAIVEAVDWPCELTTHYAPQNLGCRLRVSSGISWVFEQVEEAIFLEDDCLPDPSFFPYCSELLERYREARDVFMISGNNFLFKRYQPPYSYYGTRFLHIWGWASWRRAWRHYDLQMAQWPALRDTPWLDQVLAIPRADRHFRKRFDATHAGTIPTWDYQWTFSAWREGGMAIAPARNLVQNIGVGSDATNTTAAPPEAFAPLESLELPLRHPPGLQRDLAADTAEALVLGVSRPRLPVLQRLKRSLLKRLPR